METINVDDVNIKMAMKELLVILPQAVSYQIFKTVDSRDSVVKATVTIFPPCLQQM